MSLNVLIVETFFENYKTKLKSHYDIVNFSIENIVMFLIILIPTIVLCLKLKLNNLEKSFIYQIGIVDNRAVLVCMFLMILFILSLKLREVKK